MSLNKLGNGYNYKNLYNIYLPGIPTVSTPKNNLEKLQIVNIEYVTNKLSIIETSISTAVNVVTSQISALDLRLSTNITNIENKVSLANNYIHITDPIYYISTYTNIIIDAISIVYLPQIMTDGIPINIANNSGSSIEIYSQNNELIYSSFHINPTGATSFVLDKFKIAKLINIINKNNLLSWVLLLS